MALLINPYRFASSFDPASLYQGGTYKGFWLDASDLSKLKQDTAGSTAVTADADPVGYWANKAPLGGTVQRRVDDTCRPLYKVVSGNSCLRFDGSNDGLDGDTTLKTATSGSQQFWTICFVAAVQSGASYNAGQFFIQGANYQTIYHQWASGTQWASAAYNAGATPSGITATNVNVYTMIYRSDGASAKHTFRLNGSQVANDASTTTDTLGSGNAQQINIGYIDGGSFGKIDLYQGYIINRELTGSDLTDLERALGAKGGVSL